MNGKNTFIFFNFALKIHRKIMKISHMKWGHRNIILFHIIESNEFFVKPIDVIFSISKISWHFMIYIVFIINVIYIGKINEHFILKLFNFCIFLVFIVWRFEITSWGWAVAKLCKIELQWDRRNLLHNCQFPTN